MLYSIYLLTDHYKAFYCDFLVSYSAILRQMPCSFTPTRAYLVTQLHLFSSHVESTSCLIFLMLEGIMMDYS